MPVTRASWVVLSVLVVIAAAYGWLAVQWQQTRSEVVRITRVVEGTPGKPGEPGEPGIGIRAVELNVLPPGADPAVRLRQGELTLGLPRGAQGPRGPQGAPGGKGDDGRKGSRGERGEQGPRGERGETGGELSKKQIEVIVALAVRAFMREHTFVCVKASERRWTCRVAGS